MTGQGLHRRAGGQVAKACQIRNTAKEVPVGVNGLIIHAHIRQGFTCMIGGGEHISVGGDGDLRGGVHHIVPESGNAVPIREHGTVSGGHPRRLHDPGGGSRRQACGGKRSGLSVNVKGDGGQIQKTIRGVGHQNGGHIFHQFVPAVLRELPREETVFAADDTVIPGHHIGVRRLCWGLGGGRRRGIRLRHRRFRGGVLPCCDRRFRHRCGRCRLRRHTGGALPRIRHQWYCTLPGVFGGLAAAPQRHRRQQRRRGGTPCPPTMYILVFYQRIPSPPEREKAILFPQPHVYQI